MAQFLRRRARPQAARNERKRPSLFLSRAWPLPFVFVRNAELSALRAGCALAFTAVLSRAAGVRTRFAAALSFALVLSLAAILRCGLGAVACRRRCRRSTRRTAPAARENAHKDSRDCGYCQCLPDVHLYLLSKLARSCAGWAPSGRFHVGARRESRRRSKQLRANPTKVSFAFAIFFRARSGGSFLTLGVG